MMQARLDRLADHAAQVSQRLVLLRASYCVLEPMIFDKRISQSFAESDASQGFEFFREGAFLLAVERAARLLDDSESRTPCIAKLMAALEDRHFVDTLRIQFWERAAAGIALDAMPSLEQVVARAQTGKDEQGDRFDFHVARARDTWERIGRASLFDALESTRDRLVAHDEFAVVELGEVKAKPLAELKWGLFKGLMPELVSIVEDLDAIYRSADWDEKGHVERTRTAVDAFWAVAFPSGL